MNTGNAHASAASLSIQEWCTHGVVVSALVATPFGVDRFLLPKLTVLTVLVVVGLGAAAVNGRLGWGRTFTALATLIAVLVASSLLSADPTTALLGTASRRMGVVSWVLLGGVALLGAAYRGLGTIDRVLRTLMVVGSVVAAIAIFQTISDAAGTRPATTLGSAAATAALLAVALVVSIAALFEGVLWQRVITGSAAAVQAIALVSTGSTAAAVGALIGASLVGAHVWRRLDGRARAASVAAGVVFLIAVLVLPGVRTQPSDADRAAESTIRGRTELLGMGAAAFTDRPVLGWGADQGRPALHAHIPEGFEARHGDDRVQDRAHNVVLDVAVWGGVLGALALLWFGVVVFLAVRRQWHDWGPRVVGAALVAYAAHLLFASPGADTDAAMWLLLGLVAPLGTKRLRPPTWAVGVTAVVLLAVSVPPLAKGLAAEYWMGKATDAESGIDTALAGDLFERAARTAATARTLEVLARYELRAGYTDRAPEVARRAEAAEPSDPYLTELRVASEAAIALLNRDTALAASAMKDARVLVEESPWDGSLHLALGTACEAAGDLDCAQAEYSAASEIVPQRIDGWIGLGRVQAALGDTDAARASLTKALEIEPGNEAAAQALSDLGA